MEKLTRGFTRDIKKRFFYSVAFLPLFFVLLDEAADTYLIHTSSEILSENHSVQEKALIYILLGLQIIFSPLQGGFSDYYLRRKSIIVSLSATLVSVLLLRISDSYGIVFLVSSIVLKGVLGNTLPIAWAGIADITSGKNVRFAL